MYDGSSDIIRRAAHGAIKTLHSRRVRPIANLADHSAPPQFSSCVSPFFFFFFAPSLGDISNTRVEIALLADL